MELPPRKSVTPYRVSAGKSARKYETVLELDPELPDDQSVLEPGMGPASSHTITNLFFMLGELRSKD